MKKKRAIIFALVGLLLVSTITLAIAAVSAQPNKSHFNLHRAIQAHWIRISGTIKQWGATNVTGLLQTQATTAALNSSISKHITSATAIWTTNTSRAISAIMAKENFTFTFYAARLPNASLSSASVANGNYFLNGTWNIAKVTEKVTILTNENGTVTNVHRDQDVTPSQAYGELQITNNVFTLKINGVDTLSGSVYRSLARSWFNPFKMTDDSANDAVSTADVKAVVQCYGAMPGWGNYNTNMDFNNNYRVDIADVSSVAANL